MAGSAWWRWAIALAVAGAAPSPGASAARAAAPVTGPTTYVNVASFPATSTYRVVYLNLPGCSSACVTPDVTTPATYRIASPGAATRSTTVTSGYSLAGLLADAGITRTPGVVVLDGDHGPVVLSGGELAAHPAPIVWIADDQVHFADARTPADYLDVPVAGPQILIQSYPGNRLTVTASTPRRRLRAGEPASITASTTGQSTGEQLHYVWKAADGSTLGSGTTLDRSWPAGSVTTIYAQVTGTDGSIGFSRPLTLTVGAVRRGRERPREGDGGSGGARSSGTRSTAPRLPAPHRVHPAPPPAARPLPRTASTATRTVTASTTTKTTPAAAPRARQHHVTTRHPPRRDPGTRVAGTAVAAATPPSSASTPERASAAPRPVAGRTSAGLGEDVWVSLAAAGALAIGALLQWGMSVRR